MVTVSHIVGKLIREEPIIEDALAKDLFNYSKLASYFHEKVEKEMGKKVKLSAIIMAIARRSEEIRKEYQGSLNLKGFEHAELAVRSGIAEIAIQKTTSCFKVLSNLYNVVDLSSGDVLNINISSSEVSIIFSERYMDDFKRMLAEENKKVELSNLSEISIKFGNKEAYLYQPGLIYSITRQLSWYNINIIELVSTYTELIIVIKSEDATTAYRVLQDLFLLAKNKKKK